MRYFIAITLIATVASASVIQPRESSSPASIIGQILDALAALRPESVAVGPAMVESGVEPIAVGPAIIESEAEYEPIAVGPAVVDFPMPDGGDVSEGPVIAPSPVVIGPGPVPDAATSAPLVQIILNINQATAESTPVAPVPVVVPETIQPEPVQIVEPAPIPPMPVHPIGVVAPESVQVIEAVPVPVEPVIIGTPIIPAPAVVLPEVLN